MTFGYGTVRQGVAARDIRRSAIEPGLIHGPPATQIEQFVGARDRIAMGQLQSSNRRHQAPASQRSYRVGNQPRSTVSIT